MNAALRLRLCYVLPALCLGAACAGNEQKQEIASSKTAPPPIDGRLFTLLPSSYTGVHFENRLEDTPELNVFTYRNFYNGGGVAVGDLNGDGLPEVMLTSNQHGNHLYLNKGHFQFQDITDEAGVGGKGSWATGVTMADVNGDGLLDIYVCYAGNIPGKQRANELYINQGLDKNGVPTFKEMAAEYGLADEGYSTQAAFFDYDHDGNLDMFLVNNSFRPVSTLAVRNTRNVRDPLGGDKLFHNDGNGHFTDVSAKAGIYGSEIAFGLGVVVSDVNRDGWPDIYVSNDFFERDYLYINNHDGTFDERLDREMPYLSYFSMGLDIADVNNDGWPDIYTTDMLPEDEYRLRTTSAFEGWDIYQEKVRHGFHYQVMRNMLQLNNGNGTFSDIGQMAGVARTDWSWSALIADFDLDGYKDIYVNDEAFVYRNNARSLLPTNHYLQVKLDGEGHNRFGVGAKVTVQSGKQTLYQELSPTRGFQSSVDYILTFGLGKIDTAQSLTVNWPDGRVSNLKNVAANQRITVKQSESAKEAAGIAGGTLNANPPKPLSQLVADITEQTKLPFVHHENEYVDFDREWLMPKML